MNHCGLCFKSTLIKIKSAKIGLLINDKAVNLSILPFKKTESNMCLKRQTLNFRWYLVKLQEIVRVVLDDEHVVLPGQLLQKEQRMLKANDRINLLEKQLHNKL